MTIIKLSREQYRKLNREVRKLANAHGIHYTFFARYGKTTAHAKLWCADRCSHDFMVAVYSLPFVKSVEYRLPKTGAIYPPCTPMSIYVEYNLSVPYHAKIY